MSSSVRRIEGFISNRFIEARLFTASSDRDDDHPTVTIVHEILFRTWDRAAGWIARNQGKLQIVANGERYQNLWVQSHKENWPSATPASSSRSGSSRSHWSYGRICPISGTGEAGHYRRRRKIQKGTQAHPANPKPCPSRPSRSTILSTARAWK